MATKIEKLELENAEVHTSPLPYEKAEDLLPDVAEIVARGFDQVSPELAQLVHTDGLTKEDPRMMLILLPAISGILRQLGGGKLKTLVPRLLLTTQVHLKNEAGETEKFELISKDDRAKCFDARPDIYFQTLWHAGKVTFARFFPAIGQRAEKKSTATASP